METNDEETVGVCTQCGEQCSVIPLDNSFDYAGTHCTGGMGGTHYPLDYGRPVSDCCEAEVTEVEDERDFKCSNRRNLDP